MEQAHVVEQKWEKKLLELKISLKLTQIAHILLTVYRNCVYRTFSKVKCPCENC